MKSLTLKDLRVLMVDVLDEPVDPPPRFDSMTFTDLGCDSLARLAMSAMLVERHGVDVPINTLQALRTPAELLECIDDGSSSNGQVV